jgi:uncharacterized protein
MKIRYLPQRALPPYVFVPGENPHPKKSGGHMEGESDPEVLPLDRMRPQESPALRYSLDLFNHGYFWESHVFFEALWNAHHREGTMADFLKAMIKLGAAGVKFKTGQKQSAIGHLERGKELLLAIMKKEGEVFLGFNLKEVIHQIEKQSLAEVFAMEIHPAWE